MNKNIILFLGVLLYAFASLTCQPSSSQDCGKFCDRMMYYYGRAVSDTNPTSPEQYESSKLPRPRFYYCAAPDGATTEIKGRYYELEIDDKGAWTGKCHYNTTATTCDGADACCLNNVGLKKASVKCCPVIFDRNNVAPFAEYYTFSKYVAENENNYSADACAQSCEHLTQSGTIETCEREGLSVNVLSCLQNTPNSLEAKKLYRKYYESTTFRLNPKTAACLSDWKTAVENSAGAGTFAQHICKSDYSEFLGHTILKNIAAGNPSVKTLNLTEDDVKKLNAKCQFCATAYSDARADCVSSNDVTMPFYSVASAACSFSEITNIAENSSTYDQQYNCLILQACRADFLDCVEKQERQ